MSGEDLKAFVDGELPAWKRWLLARKIARSPELQAELAALRKLSEDLAALDLPEASLSSSLRERLLATAPEATVGPAPTQRSPAKLVAFGLVGAAAMAALVVVFRPQANLVPASSSNEVAKAPALQPVATAKSQEAARLPEASAPMAKLDVQAGAAARAAAPAASSYYATEQSSQVQNGNMADRLDNSAAKSELKAGAPVFTKSNPLPAARALPKAEPERQEVIELVAQGGESEAQLRKRVESAVVGFGGKVLKQDPLQVRLPQALRSTARQKLLALIAAPPADKALRLKGTITKSAKVIRLKVTVSFKG